MPNNESTLPDNRKEVFSRTAKGEYMTMLKCGLFLLLFSLPLFAVMFAKDLILTGITNAYATENITVDECKRAYLMTLLWCGVAMTVASVVSSLGFAGVFRIIRMTVLAEGGRFGQEFCIGVKQNGASFVISFIMLSIVFTVFKGTVLLSRNMLLLIPIFLAVIVLVPSLLLTLSLTTVYKGTFGAYFQSALVLFCKTFFTTLLAALATLVPIVLLLIPNIYIKYAFIVVFTVFGASLVVSGWFLYSCSLFDKHINKEQFPDLYRKGLQKPPAR